MGRRSLIGARSMFSLSESQRCVREVARQFAEDKLFPVAAALDAAHAFPRDVVRELGGIGMMGCQVSEGRGGAGLDTVSYAAAVEEISRGCASTGAIMSVHNSLYCDAIEKYLNSEELLEEFLRPYASGERVGAFGLSEPGNGSDAAAAAATAVYEEGEWVLSGTKAWTTNGGVADAAVVFATTDKSKKHKGISAFVVPTDAPGFSFGKPEDKLGIRASTTASLILDGVRVPREYLLGKEGDGFKIAMRILDSGRIGIAAQGLGIARAALELAANYSSNRDAFGKPISSLYAIQLKLSEMATSIEGARLLTWRAAAEKDAGMPFSKSAAMAKLCASEAATKTAHAAMQILGGMGFVTDLPAERYYRDARITEIYEGTSEIMHLVIATNLLKEYQATTSPTPA
ncbi:hypothetical protein CTAYLR_009806 [Chrysophaeum taylorii]|uniref:Short-chain specific acyl-CoA dehydrogenase, mitochondrial n=1 Tax=Chrysophaeum taylorii TaxID=2483200 RepID=A0AAD7U6X0_9STRA|nr:hypothetical protein CTAYLR_009806 [Chrysophaeum taylorii]